MCHAFSWNCFVSSRDEAARQWQKREAEWERERLARERLMAEVINQIKHDWYKYLKLILLQILVLSFSVFKHSSLFLLLVEQFLAQTSFMIAVWAISISHCHPIYLSCLSEIVPWSLKYSFCNGFQRNYWHSDSCVGTSCGHQEVKIKVN